MEVFRAVKYNLRFLFSRREFYISIIIMLVVLTIHFMLSSYLSLEVRRNNIAELMTPYAYHLPLDDETIAYEYIMILLFPLLGGFMFSECHLIEKNNQMSNVVDVRLGYKNNFYAKIIVIFFSVFIITCLCLGFNAVLNYILYSKENLSDMYGQHVYNLENEGYSMLEYFRVYHLNIYVLLNIFKFSFYSALLSLMAFGVSLHNSNKIFVNFIIVLFLLVSHIGFSLLQTEHISLVSTLNFSTKTQLSDFIISSSYLGITCLLLIKFGMKKRTVGL